MDPTERLTSELVVVKNLSNSLENRMVNHEKLLSKAKKYGHQNIVEIPGISNKIPIHDLEEKVVQICKDNITITPMDIKDFYRLSLRRKSTNTTKHRQVFERETFWSY